MSFLHTFLECRIPNWSETESIFIAALIKVLYTNLIHGLGGHHNEHNALKIVFGNGRKACENYTLLLPLINLKASHDISRG
jgi:hypothetical protein